MLLPPREFLRSAEALSRRWTRPEAEAYTRWLARHHYENFHVVSLLLPRRLHQDFYNVYAFCRWADDLGDELDSPQESLKWLAWWREQTEAAYEGHARHPVFVALRGTIERHALPSEPLLDLIQAFVQDQTVTRYEDYPDLFAYCRYSANPVGRIVLHLCGYADPERQRLSDATCTGLQLANFWQDVARDLDKGRIYLPLRVLARHGCRLEDVLARRATPEFRSAMRELTGVARRLFQDGLPLAGMVDRRLAVDIELFSRGGLLILDKIEAQDCDVFRRRPAISKSERAWLLVTTAARAVFARAA